MSGVPLQGVTKREARLPSWVKPQERGGACPGARASTYHFCYCAASLIIRRIP